MSKSVSDRTVSRIAQIMSNYHYNNSLFGTDHFHLVWAFRGLRIWKLSRFFWVVLPLNYTDTGVSNGIKMIDWKGWLPLGFETENYPLEVYRQFAFIN